MNRLKELRKSNGYTLEKVASKLNIGANTLSQYETGKREANYEMLKALADFYDVSIDYLLGNEDDEQYNVFRELRRSKHLTQIDLAEKMNVDQSTISKWEQDKAIPDIQTLSALADFFNVSVDYLLGKESKIDRNAEPVHFGHTTRIPVLGVIPAGVPIEAVEDIIEYIDIPSDWLNSGSFFALKVRGNSMTPRINNGDTVIFRQQDDAETGQICAVMVNGDDATIKKIKKEATGIWLIPENPACDFEPTFFTNEQIIETPVRIIGLAVEIRRKI